MTGLHVQLDAPLPAELAVGAGTALFVAGWCAHTEAEIAAFALVVDGETQPVTAHGMPRLDVLARRPAPTAAASGASSASCRARAPRSGVLALRAELAGGGTAEGELARLPAPPPPGRTGPPGPSGRTARWSRSAWPPTTRRRTCCERQLDSIRAQTHRRLDLRDLRRLLAPRALRRARRRRSAATRASRSRARRGGSASTGNFERALGLAPPDARLRRAGRPGRRLAPRQARDAAAGAIGDAQLVYSDARIVDRDGAVLAETYWERRRNNHADLTSLLVANAVTGAASLLPARAARRRAAVPARAVRALPRPLARRSCALALGEIAYVDRGRCTTTCSTARPTLGHAAANRMPGAARAARAAARDPRERVRLWRMHYFVDVCRLHAGRPTVLQLRCGDRMAARKRRALARFLRAEQLAAGARPPLARAGARADRAARDARRRVDARPRVRLAAPAGRAPPATARSGACGSTPSRRPTLDPAPGRSGPEHGPRCARSPTRSRRSRSTCARRRAARGSTC